MKKKILWLCVIFVIVLVGCLLLGNYRFNPPLAYTQYYIIESSLNDPVIKKAIDEACKIVDSSTTELGYYCEGEKEIYPLKKFKRIKGINLFNCCLKSVLVIKITSKNKLGIYEGEVTSEDWHWGKRRTTALAGKLFKNYWGFIIWLNSSSEIPTKSIISFFVFPLESIVLIISFLPSSNHNSLKPSAIIL